MRKGQKKRIWTPEQKSKIHGKIYDMDENRVGMKNLQVCFEDEKGFLCYDTPQGAKKLAFGMGKYTEESVPETHYPGYRLGCPANREYRCINHGAWIQENILAIRTQVTDEFVGNLTIVSLWGMISQSIW